MKITTHFWKQKKNIVTNISDNRQKTPLQKYVNENWSTNVFLTKKNACSIQRIYPNKILNL